MVQSPSIKAGAAHECTCTCALMHCCYTSPPTHTLKGTHADDAHTRIHAAALDGLTHGACHTLQQPARHHHQGGGLCISHRRAAWQRNAAAADCTAIVHSLAGRTLHQALAGAAVSAYGEVQSQRVLHAHMCYCCRHQINALDAEVVRAGLTTVHCTAGYSALADKMCMCVCVNACPFICLHICMNVYMLMQLYYSKCAYVLVYWLLRRRHAQVPASGGCCRPSTDAFGLGSKRFGAAQQQQH